MKKHSILLVDADGDCAELVALAAAQTDHETRWVKTSREAFAILSRQVRRFAAVIVDVDPGAHGLALLEAVSSCAERPPMLVLTSLEEAYMESIAKRHGAAACMGKPIGMTKLRATLRKVCAQHSLTSDSWGHLTAPPVDRGLEVKAAARGISRKMSISATKSRRPSQREKGSRAMRGAAQSMNRSNLRNILVPTDFSPISIEAIEAAKNVARYFGATIHLVYVHHEQYPVTFMGPVFSAGRPAVTFEEHRRETLRGALEELARRCELPATGTLHLREGAVVFHEVCRLAKELPADLIVMPTHGRTGLKHVFLGSTAERVVQHAPCPVLVARRRETRSRRKRSTEEAADRIKTILVPVDFSDASVQAMKYAIEFARRVPAQLLVFHAVYPGNMASVDGLVAQRVADLTKIAEGDATRRMREFVGLAKFRGVKYETVVQTGRPVSEICDFAKEREVDLIITATHGRTGFEHLTIGSVAEQVVRRADRSVLVVPSHPRARIAGLTGRAVKREAPIAA
jgi:nucleotide-binding universal stress UspA family protein/DNA-binding response OmpR family regulator